MHEVATGQSALGTIFVVLGGILTIGLVASWISRRLPVPNVTILVLAGLVLGPHATGILPESSLEWFPLIADMTLVLIGFLLGEHLTRAQLQRYGKAVLASSLGETTVTAIVVTVACFAAGLPLHLAILLGAIAPATAPAATLAVVEESGAQGRVTETLLQVVAIDDAWGIILFSIALAMAGAVSGGTMGLAEIAAGFTEIGISAGIGVAFGLPLALFTSRTRDTALTLAETMGMSFLAAGVAILMQVSYLLAAVCLGIVVANISHERVRTFKAVHSIIFPFTSAFFVLAGASFDMTSLQGIGLIGIVYIVARSLGKMMGGGLGAKLGGLTSVQARWFGMALLPQAGVALGMALIAADRYPAHKQQIFGVVVGATIVFELLGPVATRTALKRTGELPTS